MMTQQTTETGASLLSKIATVPPVTAGAVTIAGFAVPDPVKILTCLWFALLIAHKIWKWRVEAQQLKQGRAPKEDDDE